MSVESDTVSSGESESSEEEERAAAPCAVSSCYKRSAKHTPCCHEPLCEKHYEDFVVPVCDTEGCPNNTERICTECQGINGEYCDQKDHLKTN